MERLRLRVPRDQERYDIAADRRRNVEKLYRQGYRQTDIADMLGITQARVSQVMRTLERTRTNKRRMLRLMPVEPAGVSA